MEKDTRLRSDQFRAEAAGHAATGRWEEALGACEKATMADPANAGAWYDKGVALEHLGRLDEALAACETALQIDAEYPEPWREKAIILNKLKRPEEALEAFDKGLKVGAEDTLEGRNVFVNTIMTIVGGRLPYHKSDKWKIRRRFRQ